MWLEHQIACKSHFKDFCFFCFYIAFDFAVLPFCFFQIAWSSSHAKFWIRSFFQYIWLANSRVLLSLISHCLWLAHCRLYLLSFLYCIWSQSIKSFFLLFLHCRLFAPFRILLLLFLNSMLIAFSVYSFLLFCSEWVNEANVQKNACQLFYPYMTLYLYCETGKYKMKRQIYWNRK